jgi:hypothetical protein
MDAALHDFARGTIWAIFDDAIRQYRADPVDSVVGAGSILDGLWNC